MSSMEHAERGADAHASDPGSSGARGSSAGGAGALRGMARGLSFDDGAALLAPVQRKTTSGGGPAKATTRGPTGPRGGAHGTDPAEVSEADVTSLSEDLGPVDSMPAALAAIGAALELFAPRPGTSASVDLRVQVFAVGLYAGLKLHGGVKRTQQGFELDGSMGLSIGLGLAAGPTTMWAGLEGTVGFAAKGDSGAECLDLVGLGIHSWLCDQEVTVYQAVTCPLMSMLKVSGGMKWLADQMFGSGFDDKVLRGMDSGAAGDEADTLGFEQSLGVDAGIEAGEQVGGAGTTVAIGGGIAGAERTTYEKGADGKLAETTESGVKGSFNVALEVGGLKVAGGASFWKPSGGEAEGELMLEFGLPGGAISSLATTIWDAWGDVIVGGIQGIDSEELRASIEAAAVTQPRATVMAALEACHLAHSAIEIVFAMHGPERSIAIELVKHSELDVKGGAVLGGGSVQAEFATKSDILHHHWTAGAEAH